MEKIKGQLESYKEQPFSLVLRFLMWIATFLTVGITVCIVGYILIRGIPNLSPEMFAWEYNTENVSMMPAIINTVLMVLLVLLIAVPVGIGAAIYLDRKSTWTDEFGKNAGCSYVRIVVRGTVYETGICNGSGTPGSSTSDQCRFRLDREKTDKEVREWRKINLR